jgi:hypothetical protein
VSRDAAIRAIRAGHDLHHGTSEDPDRALLDGDRLYAEGLATLAADGDMEAVHVMAEVIAASAAALAAGDTAASEAAWEQGIRSLTDAGEAG